MTMEKDTETFYQEFRKQGFDHISARELEFVAVREQRNTKNRDEFNTPTPE